MMERETTPVCSLGPNRLSVLVGVGGWVGCRFAGGDWRPFEEREAAPGGEEEQAVRDAHAGQGGLHRRGELRNEKRNRTKPNNGRSVGRMADRASRAGYGRAGRGEKVTKTQQREGRGWKEQGRRRGRGMAKRNRDQGTEWGVLLCFSPYFSSGGDRSGFCITRFASISQGISVF